MAYATPGEGALWLFRGTRGYWKCYQCKLSRQAETAWLDTIMEVEQHIQLHLDRGHQVPPRCIKRVAKEVEIVKQGGMIPYHKIE